MTDFLRTIATLREQMQAELMRTDALRPLVWPIAGLLLTLSLSVAGGAPNWLVVSLVIALGIALSAYIVSYGYFAIKDPDALRSEKYKLQKLAIEQGFFGDSTIGLHKIEDSSFNERNIKVVPEIGVKK